MDVAQVRSLVAQLGQLVPALPPQIRDDVQPTVRKLEVELERGKPDKGKLAQLLLSVRSSCEGAIGNLAATGVVEGIKALLGGS